MNWILLDGLVQNGNACRYAFDISSLFLIYQNIARGHLMVLSDSFSQVRWDDANKHGRVSPWEIELSGSFSSSNCLLSPSSKRNRVGLPSGKPEFMVPGRFFSITSSLPVLHNVI